MIAAIISTDAMIATVGILLLVILVVGIAEWANSDRKKSD